MNTSAYEDENDGNGTERRGAAERNADDDGTGKLESMRARGGG